MHPPHTASLPVHLPQQGQTKGLSRAIKERLHAGQSTSPSLPHPPQ